MALKKSELYSTIWKSCDELRGGMDASQYKDYVLILLFIKYVSDRYAGDPKALIVVPEGGSFADLVTLKGNPEIGDKINQTISKLAEANGLKGVIDVADFNDQEKLGKGKEMVDRLSNLVALFNNPNLDFRNNSAGGDDLLGDAYEYLMKNFATESGKSKGQFYTPAEVSRIMAKVIGVGGATKAGYTIYDPTCGSGSLLLKAYDEARHLTHFDLTLYGQEMDIATAGLAKMNMILHNAPEAEIWKDNTLSSPYFKNASGGLMTHDFVVANPPFSTKAWSSGIDPLNDPYNRFVYGIPPEKNGDYAFLLHVLASLKPTGKGAIILPHGVLFRGGAESTIRTTILKQGYIKGIIGLPANLFFGTGIPACIIILDKEGAVGRKGVFLIDASKGFIKDGPKNRLRTQDIHKIVDTFNKGIEIDRYSRLVPLSEIESNDFNLNIPRYIDSSDPEDLQDIDAHLRGGIPIRDIDALGKYWEVFPGLQNALFQAGDRAGYMALKPSLPELKKTIFDHAEFTTFNENITFLFGEWKGKVYPSLRHLCEGIHPKSLIEKLSESLLETFKPAHLIDAYDVYQHLLNYWDATMQDDVYQISQIGWQPMVEIKPNTELLPTEIVIATFFKTEAEVIEVLETERDEVSRKIEELCEEHGGEEGILKGVSTVADIEKSIHDALLILWNQSNHDSFDCYNKYNMQLNNLQETVRNIEQSRLFDKARNPKGKVIQTLVKNLKKNLISISDQELFTEYEKTKTKLDDIKRASQRLYDEMYTLQSEHRLTPNSDEYFTDFCIALDYRDLRNQESIAKKKVKEAQNKLDGQVTVKYFHLDEATLKDLVIEKKWLATLGTDVQTELDRLTQALSTRIKELAERYQTPLPALEKELAALSATVEDHLKTMGFAW